jgi:hypothetical protein
MTGPIEYPVSVDFYYKATSDATTWTLFDPVGGCIDSVQINEGRAGSIESATLPGVYRVRWSVDDVSEFALFDVLREGLPIYFEFNRAGYSPMAYYGWISEPLVEDPDRKQIELNAGDGLGRLVRTDRDDYITAALIEAGVGNYWKCDESSGTLIQPTITDSASWRLGAGRWYDDAANYTVGPLRPGLEAAQRLTDPAAVGEYQSAEFGTFTGAGAVESHMMGATFRLTEPLTSNVETIVGFTELTPPPSAVRTIGFERRGMIASAVVRSSTGKQFIGGEFVADPDVTYTGVISYRVTGTTFAAHAHIVGSDGSTPVFRQTSTGTRATSTFSPFTAGPTSVVIQDVFLTENQSLASAVDTETLCLELQGHRNRTTGELFHRVAGITGLPFAPQNVANGAVIPDPIGALSTVAEWMRQLETTEQGAVFWDGTQLRFISSDDLALVSSSGTFGNDGTVGATPYRPGPRTWSPIRNRVVASGPQGVEITELDQASIDRDGDQQLAVNVLSDNLDTLQAVAGAILEKTSKPRRRYPSITHDHHTTGDAGPLFWGRLFARVTVRWPDGVVSTPFIVGRNVSYSHESLTVTLVVEELDPIPAGDPPVNTVLPVLSGVFGLGETVTGTTGTWTGTAPIFYAYRWQWTGDGAITIQNVTGTNGDASTLDIPLAPGPDYTDRRLRLRVVATNRAGGTAVAYSAWSTPVEGASVPQLISVQDISTSGPYFQADWSYSGESATDVRVEWSTSPTFATLTGSQEYSGAPPTTTISVFAGLSYGVTYYVRVRMTVGAADSGWSNVLSVTLTEPSASSTTTWDSGATWDDGSIYS